MKKVTKAPKGIKGDKWKVQTFVWKPTKQSAKELQDIANAEKIIREHQLKDLRELAIYLEGIKKGSGSLYPLGTNCLDSLWKAIKRLNDLEQSK